MGRAIAAALPQGAHEAVVWADDFIEARPDAMLYARRTARECGGRLTVRWAKKAMLAGELPGELRGAFPRGEVERGRERYFLLIRTDTQSPERERYSEAIKDGRLRRVALTEESLASYSIELYEVLD